MDACASLSCCPAAVRGTACSPEGASACGEAPICTDVKRIVTCTCVSGVWDCGHCPPCVPTVVIGEKCGGMGEVCEGPTTALLCNGASVEVDGSCGCSGGWNASIGWMCDGVDANVVCDAGVE